jgi:hypothetical protein
LKIADAPIRDMMVDNLGRITSQWVKWFRQVADSPLREIEDANVPHADPPMKTGEMVILRATGEGKMYLVYFDGREHWYWDKDAEGGGGGGTTDHAALDNLVFAESGHTGFSADTHDHDGNYSPKGHNHDGEYESIGAAASAVSSHEIAYDHDDIHAQHSDAETDQSIGSIVNGAAAKSPPADADLFAVADSADSNKIKKLTWAQMKSAISGESGPGVTKASYLYQSEVPVSPGMSHRFYADRDGSIQWCRAAVVEGDHSEAVEVDIRINGTTIYTTADKPTVAIGNYIGSPVTPDVTAFEAGDYFEIEILSTGNTEGQIRVYIHFLY